MAHKFAPVFTITNEIAEGLTLIERARGFIEAASLSEDWIRNMEHRALVLEAHHTTHIEGTHLSLDQAERLLKGQSVPEADPEDARELLNYRTAFDFVAGYVKDAGPLTEGLIREIHKLLVKDVRGGSAAPGEYRKIQNYVVNSATGEIIYTPPASHEVPVLMAEMVAWLNEPQNVHPVLSAGIAQFQLVHIHPFLDGNGRTSRLLSTLCLYRAGYDFKRLFTISEYYDRNRPAFYRAIQQVRESHMDMTGWLDYFVGGLSTQLAEVRQRGERKIRLDGLARQHSLSARQVRALEHVYEHGDITIQDFEDLFPDLNRRSLQRDLKALTDMGLLVSEGSTNNLAYRLADPD